MMVNATAIRDYFRLQAAACRRLGSPFTGRLCDLMADRLSHATRAGARVLAWAGDPVADAVALRLAGALHALVLTGKDVGLASIYPPDGEAPPDDHSMWLVIEEALHTHDGFVHDWLNLAPQTNEVARAAMILPALAQLAARFNLPLALYEVGASAGLTLQLMQFHYDFAGTQVGDVGSPVHLCPHVRTSLPLIKALPAVVSRQGCDLNPLDTTCEADAMRLRSYVWADQRTRHDRVNGAMKLYAADSPTIERKDAAVWVAEELGARPAGAISVFYHTVVWQYLSHDVRSMIEQSFADAGSAATPDAPLAFLGMEGYGNPDHALLELTTWSGDATADGRKIELAHVDYHGRWLDWVA